MPLIVFFELHFKASLNHLKGTATIIHLQNVLCITSDKRTDFNLFFEELVSVQGRYETEETLMWD